MRYVLALVMSLLCAVPPVSADIPKPTTYEQTLDLMLERLLPDFPDATIDRANLNIVLDAEGDMIVNPDNIHAVLQTIDDGAAREAELDRFIAIMATSIAQDPFDDGLPLCRVFPALRHESLITMEGSEDLFWTAGPGDMVQLYVLDYPDRVAYVTNSAMTEANIEEAQIALAATRNLDTKLGQLQFQFANGAYFTLGDGFYESSFLLDNGLLGRIAGQLGDDLILIAPARDMLVFAPASDPAGVDFLDYVLEDMQIRGTHLLSDMTYRWSPSSGLSIQGQ